MENRRKFTVERGLEVQSNNLAFWQQVLKPEVYAELEAAVHMATAIKECETGYDVPRGQDIHSWVMCYPEGRIR